MTKFAKRHYEAIALAMHEAYPMNWNDPARLGGWRAVRHELANLFAGDNPRFNRERFVAACEPGANVKLRTRYAIAAE